MKIISYDNNSFVNFTKKNDNKLVKLIIPKHISVFNSYNFSHQCYTKKKKNNQNFSKHINQPLDGK